LYLSSGAWAIGNCPTNAEEKLEKGSAAARQMASDENSLSAA
jgi:hypothetical protein